MNIGAFCIGRIIDSKTMFYIAWHHPKDVTWRWTFSFGISPYKYWIKPHANFWSNNQNGSYTLSAFCVCLHFNWQPAWDRNFNWEEYRAKEKQQELTEATQIAMQERESQQRLQ